MKYHARLGPRGWYVTGGPPRSFWYLGNPAGLREHWRAYDAARRVAARMNALAHTGEAR